MSGAVTFSLDFEAGWGVVGNGQWRAREAAGVYRELRPVLRNFVALLDDLEIKVCWAVVGAMIDDPEARDLSHLKGSFAEKMATFVAAAEPATKDGRDLLDIVLAARMQHDFATHSYSHVLFSDLEQDADVYRADLALARAANRRAGLAAEALVFPENRAAHFDVVRAAGINVARMHAFNAPAPDARPRLPMRFASALLRPTSPVVVKTLENGLRLHFASELLAWGSEKRRVKSKISRRRLTRALSAAEQGMHVHFWLHPFDLVTTPGLTNFLVPWLQRIVALRSSGKISIVGFQ